MRQRIPMCPRVFNLHSSDTDNTQSDGGVTHGHQDEGEFDAHNRFRGKPMFNLRSLLRGCCWAIVACSALPSFVYPSSVPVGAKTTPNPEPFTRRITLPPLKLLRAGQQRAESFEPRSWRFSHVCVLGPWHKGYQSVHDYFQKHTEYFARYKIAAVGAFSHDTPENLAVWADKMKPRYLFGLAQTEFVDKLKNPKVPTCWLLSREGQILLKIETPSDQDLSSVYDKLKLWTEF